MSAKTGAADIRTAHGKTNRPISKLSPIEVSEPFIEPQSESFIPTDDITAAADSIIDHHAAVQPNQTRRPRRQAAEAARNNIPRIVDALHRQD